METLKKVTLLRVTVHDGRMAALLTFCGFENEKGLSLLVERLQANETQATFEKVIMEYGDTDFHLSNL
ncbi:hypothetical protein [Paenibacillus jilunlii]|uniref:Uncharacterized protein n=1 Tax=Paenibacillus jilunlii TaxID=682956 RepID=A0ABR5SR73_9BACL|nr:hypothetical protein [Paenibacillus jilunlii]KWX72363.1 hypothetical protein AML91_21340 [Paenibacillus jilunlii]